MSSVWRLRAAPTAAWVYTDDPHVFAEADFKGWETEEFVPALRYKVAFTPAGWQVVDSVIAHDPLAEFGTGPDEYRRAKAEADRLNLEDALEEERKAQAEVDWAMGKPEARSSGGTGAAPTADGTLSHGDEPPNAMTAPSGSSTDSPQ